MNTFNIKSTYSFPTSIPGATKQVRFGKLFQWSPIGTMVTDAACHILYVNPAFERVTGYSVDEVIGQTPALLRSGRHTPDFYKAMWRSIQTCGSWQGEIWNCNKSGVIYPEMLTINRMVDDLTNEVWHLGQFLDITQLKKNEDLWHYQATHDALTGLANNFYMRRHLDRVLTQARSDLREFAVLYIDLDGFKLINDTCGHQEGDAVLKEFAKKLKASVRETDFVARVGGDEFVIVLDTQGADETVAYEVAEKVLAAISTPLESCSPSMIIGCSIGISIFPSHGESVNELLNAADMAMYRVKRQGGGFSYT